MLALVVEHCLDEGANRLPNPGKLRMPARSTPGVRQWGLSFIVKRETAQTAG